MGKLLLSLLLLAGIAVGADLAVTAAAERRVAGEVQQSIGAPSQVDLQGWPVSLGLLRGEIPSATIRATDVPMPEFGATLPQVDIDLTDIRLPHADGGDGTIQAGSGRFTARIDQPTLAEIAAAATDIGTLQISGENLQVVVNGVAVDLEVTTRDGQLVVRPLNDLLSALSGGERAIPMNGLPVGTSVDDVQIEGGALLLSGPVDVNRVLAGSAPA